MLISINDIEERTFNLFIENGLERNQAGALSENLVLTERAGITTHGLRMIPAYVEKIRCKQFNLNPQLQYIVDEPSFCVVDCDNAIGAYSAYFVIEDAIKRASRSGLMFSWCRNANTYGAAFAIVQKCISRRMIGITCANSPAQMAPMNGIEKLLGTNPLCIGIPTSKEIPFVLDMATSVVAKSKINEMKDKNTQIPLGWALDQDGNPTQDPYEAVKGLILPMAGAKGYGLSMAIDMVAGLLSGASYLNGVGRFYSSDAQGMNVGQLYIVIDPIKIYGSGFYDAVDGYLKRIYMSKSIKDKEINYPGVGKFRAIQKSANELEVADGLFRELTDIGW